MKKKLNYRKILNSSYDNKEYHMKTIKERIADFIQSVWYSYWRFAIWNVLTQWFLT